MDLTLAFNARPQAKVSVSTAEHRLEPAVSLAATLFIASLLVFASLNAGALWRDETNSINLAQMPTLTELWNNMQFDSSPLLWPMVLRGWSFLGLAGTDAGIRMLGLMIGLSGLGSLWLCTRWIDGRCPTISLALLGSLPMFISVAGTNRAYGLALCLLPLNFGAIWRVLESPSKVRVAIAILTSLLFVHCLYYNGLFLYSMLFAAAIVVIRRKEWKTLLMLTAIAAVSGLSMLIYYPIIRQSPKSGFSQVPFDFWTLWTKIGLALTAQSNARIPTTPGPEIWFWSLLLLVALGVTILIQGRWTRQSNNFHWSLVEPGPARIRADVALFGSISFVCGTIGYACFLLWLQLPTESWYYAGALALCAVGLEATLGVGFQALRPWGILRICLLVLLAAWGANSVMEQANTRRTNVDLLAEKLRKEAREGDLVLVYGPWEAISFDRYYHGSVRWMSVPPIGSHKFHRSDLVIEKLSEAQPLGPVFTAIDEALAGEHSVWVVGHVVLARNVPPMPSGERSLGARFGNWSAQVMAHILARAHSVPTAPADPGNPVSYLENLPVRRFVKGD